MDGAGVTDFLSAESVAKVPSSAGLVFGFTSCLLSLEFALFSSLPYVFSPLVAGFYFCCTVLSARLSVLAGSIGDDVNKAVLGRIVPGFRLVCLGWSCGMFPAAFLIPGFSCAGCCRGFPSRSLLGGGSVFRASAVVPCSYRCHLALVCAGTLTFLEVRYPLGRGL